MAAPPMWSFLFLSRLFTFRGFYGIIGLDVYPKRKKRGDQDDRYYCLDEEILADIK